MSCAQARDIDMAAYLVEPDAPEWAAFREHFLRCSDCAAEVAAWSRLEASLLDAGGAPGGAHPEPAALARYHGDPRALSRAELRRIGGHVRDCRTCADGLAALNEFDFEGVKKLAPQSFWSRVQAVGRSVRALFGGGGAAQVDGGGAGEELVAALQPAVALQDAQARAQRPERQEGRLLAVLAVIGGDQAGEVFAVRAGESRLGRASECEIRIAHPEMPRVAARLVAREGTIELFSEDPRKPALVNGSPSPRRELGDGDVVELGGHRLQLRRVSSA